MTALLTTVSCSDLSSPSTAGRVPTIDVTLSSDHPSVCLRVSDAERVVELGVIATQNPRQRNVELDVLADGKIVTVFGVYPPTNPQRFRTRLSTGAYSVELRSDSNVVADTMSVELEISGATIC